MKSWVMMMLSTLLLAGCATGTGGWEVSLKEGQGEIQQFRADDVSFAKKLVVERTRIHRASSGFAVAEVDVRSTEKDDLNIQYRFVFFDRNGSPILPGVRAWEQLTIHGGEIQTLMATASSKDAVGFRVRTRRMTEGE